MFFAGLCGGFFGATIIVGVFYTYMRLSTKEHLRCKEDVLYLKHTAINTDDICMLHEDLFEIRRELNQIRLNIYELMSESGSDDAG